MAVDDTPPLRRNRRGHGRATLADVAGVAEVTKITVSRYLREPTRVAAATAERIRAALASTGYVPNKQAGLLASGRSNIVAALIPNLGHSIFGETVQALSEALQAAGHELLLASTGYSPEREEEQLRALLGWAPLGLVITGRHHTDGARRLLADAHAAGTPIVEVWDHQPGENSPFAQIGFNHAQVGRAMAQHLLAAGHRALAYVDSGVDTDFRAHERGTAFADEARRAGASIRLQRAAKGDPFDAGRQALRELLSAVPDAGPAANAAPGIAALPGRPSAVACANDHLACGLLMQAQAQGLRVPQDLAVLGFGDFPVGRQLQPALSTVQSPSQQIGQATAQALLAALRSGLAPASQALPWQLIVRGSTSANPPSPT
jgi:LacI family gluconate utilization system Gnt-I transcriptional repressor